MEREQKARAQARLVAYGDLIVSGIEMFILIVLEILAESYTFYVLTGKKLPGSEFVSKMFGLPKDSQIIILRRVWVIVFIFIFIWGFQLWAAINLYVATDANRSNVEGSLQKCYNWWAVTSILFIVWTIFNIITCIGLFCGSEDASPYVFFQMIHPIYLFMSLRKVGRFMDELQRAT